MSNETALEQYRALYDKCQNREYQIWSEELSCVLEQMKMELLIQGNSQLFSNAYWLWAKHFSNANEPYLKSPHAYQSKVYAVTCYEKLDVLGTYDAWHLLRLLPKYMKEEYEPEEIECIAEKFCRGLGVGAVHVDAFSNYLKPTDEAILECRKKVYTTAREQAEAKIKTVKSLLKMKEEKIKEVEKTAEKSAENIVAEAEKQAEQIKADGEKEVKEALERAEVKAKKLQEEAESVAEKKLAEAKKRAMELTQQPRNKQFEEEKELFENSFREIQKTLFQVHEKMKQSEQQIMESNTRKVFANLSELYFLIEDVKESQMKLLEETENADLENATYNLDVFLEMISEYMSDYGVKTILTPPGQPFNMKYHEVTKASKVSEYDPKNVLITESLRCGFLWGEQVLKKEIVKID